MKVWQSNHHLLVLKKKNPDPIIIFKTKLGLASNHHEAFKRRSQFAE